MNRDFPLAFLLVACLILVLPRATALPDVSSAYSSNWSGYVVTAPGPYTAANATWTVPYVSAISPPAYSSIWVGIGGSFNNSRLLIQVGTDQDIQDNGTAVYYAWHEVLPERAALIGYISPGDLITASVSQLPSNVSAWRMLLVRNSTTLANITVRVPSNLAVEDTAEFIVERPAIQVGRREQLTTLANFGNVTFSNCSTNQGPLSSSSQVAMVAMKTNATSNGTLLAQPSAIDASTNGFSVQYSAASSVGEFSNSTVALTLVLISGLSCVSQISRNRRRDRARAS